MGRDTKEKPGRPDVPAPCSPRAAPGQPPCPQSAWLSLTRVLPLPLQTLPRFPEATLRRERQVWVWRSEAGALGERQQVVWGLQTGSQTGSWGAVVSVSPPWGPR